jgi:hypothetical protein
MGKSSVIVILKKKNLIQAAIIVLILIFILAFLEFFGQKVINVNASLHNETIPVKIAQNGLEPEMPQDITETPYFNRPIPSKKVTITEVIAYGREIPIDFIYNDPNWKREAYKEYWHSQYKRWSYVPMRLQYMMHRLFTTYPTASVYYDFIHNLGIAEESEKFKSYLPTPPKDKSQKVNPFQKIETVIMQTDIKKIITYGNQIVLIGEPRRTGLQALVIPIESLKPFNTEENILFQLATSEGDEIDYSVIELVEFKADK